MTSGGPANSSSNGASGSRPSGEWNDDDYDVLADGVVVGRIRHAAAAPVGAVLRGSLPLVAERNSCRSREKPPHPAPPLRRIAVPPDASEAADFAPHRPDCGGWGFVTFAVSVAGPGARCPIERCGKARGDGRW
jgi:hypothetical protein